MVAGEVKPYVLDISSVDGKGKRVTSGYPWGTDRIIMMLLPELEVEGTAPARSDAATSGNIVELCQQYLALLAEYRAELYKLPDTLGIDQWSVYCYGKMSAVSGTRSAPRLRIPSESATGLRRSSALSLR